MVDAARLCATTPARQLGLEDTGRLEVGAIADVAVLDKRSLYVRATYVRGAEWHRAVASGGEPVQ
jgi:N-acetylglucosamine-6-phosphate deacetylase